MMHIVIPCLIWLAVTAAGIGIGNLILAPLHEESRPTFAERVERELRNPDPDVRAALREVDGIGWAAPPAA